MKTGDRVRIIANHNAHGFEIGYEGNITRVKDYPSGAVAYEIDYNWWVFPDEIEVVEGDKTDENVTE